MNRLIPILAFSLLSAACSATANPGRPTVAPETPSMAKSRAPHVISIESNADFATTLTQLRNAIDKRGFKTFAVIDHAAGAASVGEALPPTTLVIFGNPRGGSPLMQAEQLMGIELPLKMLVTEDMQGVVKVTRYDMTHVFANHGIASLSEPLARVNGALSAIAAEAAVE